ncbi:hypothetical protein AB1Y20_013780 [Prymnesium parvum]|uniref:TIR domain-containing protein n=1 Tax=Prymnesium parvum TaxID=97485 RepID=A0AB34IGS7_PRYPA
MSMPAALLITFCFVTSVSATIFKAWSCQPFQDDPTNSTWHYYLRTNPEIRCSSAEYISAEHDEITGVALPFILVWPVGLPLLYSCLLLLCRSALQERKPTKLSHAIRFLHKEYRAEYYWWEAFDLLRKLLLTGFVLLIPERISFIRLVMAVLTSLSTLLLLLAARPYKTEDNHMIGVAAQLGLTLVFLGAIFTKLWEDIYLIAGEDTAEEVMGFSSTFAIVSTMIVFSISLLALVSMLTLYRMVTDRRVRVLRLAPSNCVPELDTAPGKYYHIFLSHIWSTGQDQVSTIKRQLMLLMPGIRAFLDVDDLEDIGNLEQYIDVSATVLVFLSRGYFESRNCGREFRCSCERELPLILLHERDLNKGGQTLAQLRSSCPKPYRPIFDPPAGVSQLEYILPWHRVYVFQLETMKRIGERILLASPTYAGKALPGRLYVPMDLSIQTFGYKTKTTVFVSPHNANAGQVCGEVCDIVGNMYIEQDDLDDHLQGFKDTLGHVGDSHRSVGTRTTGGSTGASDERASTRRSSVKHHRSTAAESSTPRFFVLYLNDQTFMDDPEGLLVQQLRDAQAAKFPIVMLHERSDDLGAVEFGVFFERTPEDLIDNGLYAKLAVPMESGSHRQISLKLAAKAMGATLVALRPDSLANHVGDAMSTVSRIGNWAGKHHHASSFSLKKPPSADLEVNNDAVPGAFVQDDESLLAELDGRANELRRRKSSSSILPKLIQMASRPNVSSPRSPHAEETEAEVKPEAILATRRSSWTVSASCSGSGRLPDDDGKPKSSPSPADTQSPSKTSTRTNTAYTVTAVPVKPKDTTKPRTAADDEGLSSSAIEIVSACSSETNRQSVDNVVAQRT